MYTVQANYHRHRSALIPNIRISITDYVQDVEGERQQSSTQQVPHRCQVWDGEVVGILAFLPQVMHQPVRNVQQ